MARLSPALCELVDLGFEILHKPHDLRAASRVPHQAAMIAQLGQQYPMQAHFLRAGEMLVQALDNLQFYRRADPDQAVAWEAVCGAALALTRVQAWKSIAWEQEHLT